MISVWSTGPSPLLSAGLSLLKISAKCLKVKIIIIINCKVYKTLFLINSGVRFGVIMGWILNQTNGENREITTGASISSSSLEAALQTQQLFCGF